MNFRNLYILLKYVLLHDLISFKKLICITLYGFSWYTQKKKIGDRYINRYRGLLGNSLLLHVYAYKQICKNPLNSFNPSMYVYVLHITYILYVLYILKDIHKNVPNSTNHNSPNLEAGLRFLIVVYSENTILHRNENELQYQ